MANKEIPEIDYQYEKGDERLSEFGVVIPEGWYKAQFVGLEMKESKKEGSGGWYANLECRIIEGAHKGTSLFEMLFLWAEAEKTAQATRRRLNTILDALEMPGMMKVNELLDKPLMIKVKTQDAREVEDENTGDVKTFAARSQLANYKSLSSYIPDPEPEATSAKPTTPPAGNKPPFGATKKNPPPAQTQAEEPPAETQAEAPTKAPAGNKPPWVK